MVEAFDRFQTLHKACARGESRSDFDLYSNVPYYGLGSYS